MRSPFDEKLLDILQGYQFLQAIHHQKIQGLPKRNPYHSYLV